MKTIYKARDVSGAGELETFLNFHSALPFFTLEKLVPFEFEGSPWLTVVISYREEVKG
jgi:hypothetical protein